MLRFRPRSGEVGIEGDNRASRGIGMPVSICCVLEDGYPDDGDVAE